MRKTIENQLELGGEIIGEIELDYTCRDAMIPTLHSLQEIYNNDNLLSEIEILINNDLLFYVDRNGDKKSRSIKSGRKGMNFWDVFVLMTTMYSCNLTYDSLQNSANNHITLRKMIGIGPISERRFSASSLHDNISKISNETLKTINDLIVFHGHETYNGDALAKIRADSFVFETNTHYPTDSRQILDALRCLTRTCVKITEITKATSWREHKSLTKKLAKLSKELGKTFKGKGCKERQKKAYQKLFNKANLILDKSLETYESINLIDKTKLKNECDSFALQSLSSDIIYYSTGLATVVQQAETRILDDEKVMHSDKLFSIFEPHATLINRGKSPFPYQMGRKINIAEDSAGFIIHCEIMKHNETDKAVLLPMMKDLQLKYNDRIKSASFDKGYHSPNNQIELAKIVDTACIPKPGKQQKIKQNNEATEEYLKAKKRHSGIESTINALHHTKCKKSTAKGKVNYEKQLRIATISRNLITLGKQLIGNDKEIADCRAGISKRKAA